MKTKLFLIIAGIIAVANLNFDKAMAADQDGLEFVVTILSDDTSKKESDPERIFATSTNNSLRYKSVAGKYGDSVNAFNYQLNTQNFYKNIREINASLDGSYHVNVNLIVNPTDKKLTGVISVVTSNDSKGSVVIGKEDATIGDTSATNLAIKLIKQVETYAKNLQTLEKLPDIGAVFNKAQVESDKTVAVERDTKTAVSPAKNGQSAVVQSAAKSKQVNK